MISSINIGSKVICTDGTEGTLTAVIVDPATRQLTHIAVVEKSLFHGEETLVPVDRVTKTTREAVYLNCTAEDLAKMDPFTRTHYLEMDHDAEGYAYSLPYMTTYSDVTMAPDLGYVTVQDRLFPEGDGDVHRGGVVGGVGGVG